MTTSQHQTALTAAHVVTLPFYGEVFVTDEIRAEVAGLLASPEATRSRVTLAIAKANPGHSGMWCFNVLPFVVAAVATAEALAGAAAWPDLWHPKTGTFVPHGKLAALRQCVAAERAGASVEVSR